MGGSESRPGKSPYERDHLEREVVHAAPPPPGSQYVDGVSWDGRATKLALHVVADLGKGAFGTVKKVMVDDLTTRAKTMVAMKCPSGPETVNIMERAALLILRHQNICNLEYYFFGPEHMSYFLLEFVEGGDLYQFIHAHYVINVGMGGPWLELFGYQMWRAIAFCHSHSIIHRDLKPENLLVNPEHGILKLTDFGCCLVMTEENSHIDMICYIGALLFRAPELLLGARRYSDKCDVWSASVIMSEMVLGHPVFYNSESDRQHMEQIIEYLGFPTVEDFRDMNVEPVVTQSAQKRHSIENRLHHINMPHHSDKAMLQDLLEHTLIYSPVKRLTAWEVLAHPFFKGLRGDRLTLPNGQPYPDLFNFTQHEIASMPENVRHHFHVS